MGGSAGHISLPLVEQHPNLKVVVQDLPAAEAAFNDNIPEKYRGRMSFQAHDFFKPQSTPADVYLIKSVLHDWPDKHVVQILKNLAAAMKPGNRIVVFDIIFPPETDEQGRPTIPRPVKKMLSGVDLQMHVLFNAKERTAEDWTGLIESASDRLKVKNVIVLPGAPLGILDAVYE